MDKVKQKIIEYIKTAKVELIVIVAVLLLDLATKIIIANWLNLGQTHEVIPNFFNLTYKRNPFAAFGSAFGLDNVFTVDAGNPNAVARFWPFLIVAILASVIAFGIIYLFFRKKHDIKSEDGKKFFIKVGVALAVTATILCVLYAIVMQFRNAMMPFFIVMTIVAACGFSIVMYRYRGKSKAGVWVRVGLALIIGGALGNWFDRLFLGYVRDFIEIVYFGQTIFGQSSFAVFNIADSALTVGVVIFAIGYIRGDGKKAENREEKTENREKVEEFDFRKEESIEDSGGLDDIVDGNEVQEE